MAIQSNNISLENMNVSPTVISNNARYGSGQAGSTNTDIVIEGSQSLGRRVDNTTNKGVGVSVPTTNLSTNHIKIWVTVVQIGLVTKLQAVVASGTGTGAVDYHTLPTSEYNPDLRNIPLWFDSSRTPEEGGGANTTSINEIGARANIGDVGGNAQNFILDEITYGTGYTWQGAGGDFQDFIDYEASNKEGVLIVINNAINAYARLVLEGGFTDSNFNITFPDQSLVADDFMGITIDNTLSSSNKDLSNGTIQSANIPSASKRPDFIVNGTTSTVELSNISLLGLRTVTFNSSVTHDSGNIDALNMVLGGADVDSINFNTRSLTNIAFMADFDDTLVTNSIFTQQGTGHAIELQEGDGNQSFVGLTFNGYGADGTSSAAINYTGTTPITLAYSGGNIPTVKGNITILTSQNTLTLTGLVNPSKIYLVDTDLPETDASYILDSQLVTSGTYTYSFSQGANVNSLYRIVSLTHKVIEQDINLNNIDITIPISQQIDREYENN